jgi:hypothetical protein
MNTIQHPLTTGLTSSEAQEVLSPFLGDIYGCVSDGWAAWLKLGEAAPELKAPMRARARASFVFDHIVDSAKRRFADDPRVRWTEKKGLFRLIFKGGVILRFKKFDRYLRTSGIATKQLLQYRLQGSLDLGEFTLVNLIGGYRLKDHQMEIQDILLTCPNGSHNEWSLEIPSEELPEIQNITQQTEQLPTIRAKAIREKKSR